MALDLTVEMVEKAAAAAHEANRVYCRSLNDSTQAVWVAAPEWQKESARNGVRAIVANPMVTPAQLHEAWLEEKDKAGWVYGEIKDPEKKTHPCLVPYSRLHAEQQLKDELFGAVVRAVLFE